MNLYEIEKEINEILDSNLDSETGELNENVFDLLSALLTTKESLLINLALAVKNAESESEAISLEAKKLKRRAEIQSNKAERIKKYLSAIIPPGEKHNDPRVVISWRKSESVNILNLSEIPSNYKKEVVTVEPDKKMIKEAILKGENILGAEIIKKNNIQIK